MDGVSEKKWFEETFPDLLWQYDIHVDNMVRSAEFQLPLKISISSLICRGLASRTTLSHQYLLQIPKNRQLYDGD